MKKSQRVKEMLKNFMKYHDEGFTIPEIAKRFNVSPSTIYGYLPQIALDNNTTREELLSKPNAGNFSKTTFYREKVDVKEIQNSFHKLDNDLDQLINSIDIILAEERK